jgi:hypothetical protein
MGFTMTPDDSVSSKDLDKWDIVWLKSLESGGAIINQATILGSHPYFGGGVVSGYALYQLNGELICSANVASYGGYVKAKKFPTVVDDVAPDRRRADRMPVRSLVIEGNCADNPVAGDQSRQNALQASHPDTRSAQGSAGSAPVN